MKTLGIIGGIGPESTIEYYRFLIAACRERTNRPPRVIIVSIDVGMVLARVAANMLGELTDDLVHDVECLAAAGADVALLASNTPHIVFYELRARSPIPLISIVEATRDAALAMGIERAGLFGTRFTMSSRFYADVFAHAGIAVISPNDEEQTYVHGKYVGELLNNVFLPETRAGLVAIANRLAARDGIQALILGGTELPLILRDAEGCAVPLLDTTRIHVDAAVEVIASASR